MSRLAPTPRHATQPGSTARTRFALAPVAAAACACLFAASSLAQTPALPVLNRVVAGANTPTVNGATMAIQQTAARGVIEWSNFNIGAGGTVNIQQPSANAVLLNRVVGNVNGSRIDGALNANGHVFILDPSGLTIGRGAAVNVGSLVASTLDLAPAEIPYDDFLRGNNIALIDGGQNVVPLLVETTATLNAAPGGNIVLLSGSDVSVSGQLAAVGGQVVLGAGGAADLPIGQSGYISLRLTAATSPNPSNNPPSVNIIGGSISAAGGQVRAEVAGQPVQFGDSPLTRPSINVSTLVSTASTTGAGGSIDLQAGPEGAVTVIEGTLDASSGVAAGGRIDVQGHTLQLGGAFGGESLRTLLDARGATGGGDVQVGGIATGSLLMFNDASILADATRQGNGGTVGLVADLLVVGRQNQPRIDVGVAEVYGAVSANGSGSGSGGQILTRAPSLLTTRLDLQNNPFSGSFTARGGSTGAPGLWEVESGSVSVVTTPPTGGLGADPVPSGAVVGDTQVGGALDNMDVSLRARANALNRGDIVVDSSSRIDLATATGERTLSLLADRDIFIDAATRISTGSSAAALNVDVLANQSDTGGSIFFGFDGESTTRISTAGGSVFIGGGQDRNTGFAESPFGGNGISMQGVVINTVSLQAGGDITVRGRGRDSEGPGNGVVLSTVDMTAGTGRITIEGVSESGIGVELGTQSSFGGAFLASDSSILVRGVAQSDFGSPTGVQMVNATINAGAGDVTILGRGAEGSEPFNVQGFGVRWENSTIVVNPTSAGTVRLIGDSDAQTGTGLGSTDSAPGSTLVITRNDEGSGSIAANVEIGARSTQFGSALEPSAAPLQVDTTGLINIRPAGLDDTGSPVAADTIDITIGNTFQNTVPRFSLSADWMVRANQDSQTPAGFLAAGEVVIGSSTHTGQIIVAEGAIDERSHPRITLQNQGAGSEGIVLGAATPGTGSTNGDRQLTLMTTGPVSFIEPVLDQLFRIGDGGDVVVPLAIEPTPGALNLDSLLIIGSGNTTVSLNNRNGSLAPLPHRINNLSFTGVSTIDVLAESDMAVRSLGATGYDSGSLAFAPSAPAAANTAVQRVNLTTDAALQLVAPIRTTGAGSSIDLVAPTQFTNNAGAQALSTGAGGTWEVWTQTWTLGSRGGLVGTGGTPNAYGCNLSAQACDAAALDPASSGFRHVLQPTLTVTPFAVSFTQGAAPPPITFNVTGLVNGDTLATAFTGSLGTTATSSSLPGTYAATQGTLVSKQGYQLNFSGGSATAVTVLAAGAFPFPNDPVPGFDRSRTLNSALLSAETNSEVNGRNLSRAQMCVAPGALRRQKDAGEDSDALGIEWSRVRSQPHLSSCLDLGDDSECAAF